MKTKLNRNLFLIITVMLLSGILTACDSHSAGLGQPANPGSQVLEEPEDSEEEEDLPAEESEQTEAEEQEEEPEKKLSFALVPPTELLETEGFPAKVIQTSDENKIRSYTFVKSLEEMLVHRALPPVEGETKREFFGEDGNENAQPLNYALMDLNNDGESEMLVSYAMDDEEQTPVMEAYGFDPYEEAWSRVFASRTPVRLFENGVMESDATEEAGLSGREVARVISKYNTETKTYEVLGTVEPWDLRAFPGRFGEDAFPDAVDENGNGLVYFLYDAEGNGGEKPVDEEEKETWINELIRGEEILVEWKPLTKENVNSEYFTIFSE